MRKWLSTTAGIFLLFIASTLPAETWSKRYVGSLPDSAFASVEITPEGKKLRHLPHHNQAGDVESGHLKSALGRIYQVKWSDSASFKKAQLHLEEHRRGMQAKAGHK